MRCFSAGKNNTLSALGIIRIAHPHSSASFFIFLIQLIRFYFFGFARSSLLSRCGAWASHCSRLACCRVQALEGRLSNGGVLA